MPRKRARGTGYLGTDKGLRELYPRLGLDEAARSQSTALHNRRKPVVGSTGTPELADEAVTNAKISDVNASKIDAGTLADARIPNLHANKINDGTLADARIPTLGKGKISGEGRFGSNDLPQSTVFGSYNGNPGRLGYGDIGGTPDLTKFAKDTDLATRTTKNQVEQIIKKKVKPNALKKGN